MNRKPLTIEELREMGGQPVYCPEAEGYGIVVFTTVASFVTWWYNNSFTQKAIEADEHYNLG